MTDIQYFQYEIWASKLPEQITKKVLVSEFKKI